MPALRLGFPLKRQRARRAFRVPFPAPFTRCGAPTSRHGPGSSTPLPGPAAPTRRRFDTDAYVRRLEVASAEAAHAVVAHALGLQIVEVSIEPDEDSVGRCTDQPPRYRAQAKAALKGEHHLPELTYLGSSSLDRCCTSIQVFGSSSNRSLDSRFACPTSDHAATAVRLLTDALLSITHLTGDDVQDLLDCTCGMHGLPAVAEQR